MSGGDARSGLGARQRVAEHSMAELLEGQSKQFKATRKAAEQSRAEQATSNHLSLPACLLACLHVPLLLRPPSLSLSLSAFFLPYSSTLIP